jgi:hypothetical protein
VEVGHPLRNHLHLLNPDVSSKTLHLSHCIQMPLLERFLRRVFGGIASLTFKTLNPIFQALKPQQIFQFHLHWQMRVFQGTGKVLVQSPFMAFLT